MSGSAEPEVDYPPRETPIQQTVRAAAWRRLVGPLALVAVVVLMSIAFQHLAREVTYAEVVDALRNTSWTRVAGAVLFTGLSFVALSFYDVAALAYVGHRMPYSVVGLASFCAYAVGNTAGFGPLSGGAVRYRFYTRLGVEPDDIARVIGYVTAAFGLGLLAVTGIGFIIAGEAISGPTGIPLVALHLMGLAALAAISGLFALSMRRDARLRFGRLDIPLPRPRVLLLQLAVTLVDIAASAAVLWILLPQTDLGLPAFTGIYAVAIGLGVLSHVPAGLGVFETVIIATIGASAPIDQVLGGLVLYRLIYYVLPLIVAVGLVSTTELRSAAQGDKADRVLRAASRIAPLVLSTLTLIAGVMLIFSGVTPAFDERLDQLAGIVPLPLQEGAHFLASVLGLGLIVVARGLAFRLDGAWWVATLMTAAAIAFSLVKAMAVYEAMLLAVLLVALLATRREFTRPASLLHQAFSTAWFTAIMTALIAALVVLLFAYKDVEYTHQLWWQFEFSAEAPRSLRALIGVVLAAGLASTWMLLRPAHGPSPTPSPQQLKRAIAIVAGQAQASANLVRMGDKSLMFSQDGRAFIMYARRARSWIALFDPVGARESWPELIWNFVEEARQHGGRAVFYQVAPENLALYADAGLNAFKLGEEARVSLPDFDLKGSKRAGLRHAFNRGLRDGLDFEMLSPAAASKLYDTLKRISDGWIKRHKAPEKRFSLGAFERDYILSQPVAVLRQDGHIVAFATVMITDQKTEATIDLMRFDANTPGRTMEFLFIRLIQHFKDEGYAWFNLGMAPLSGMSESSAAPVWHRIAQIVFKHGEAFYNFRGLRAFKAKFMPDWQPRYMTVAGGLNPVLALADVAILISGSVRRMIRK